MSTVICIVNQVLTETIIMKRVLTSLFMFVTASLLFAGDQKIAVIDMDRLFTEYYKTKISDANLKKQADIFRNYA